MVRVEFIKVKRALTPTRIYRGRLALNPYIGCSHGCLYCYARFMCRWYDACPWGTKVLAKINLPKLLRREKPRGLILVGTTTDAYQPVEEELQLTRKAFEALTKEARVSILTKSPLVLRDLELLKKFKDAEIGFTLSFWGKFKQVVEPKTPELKERIEALKKAKKEGLRTFAFIAPILPGFTPVTKLVRMAKPYADYFFFEFINLKAAGEAFRRFLHTNIPEAVEGLRNPELLIKWIEELASAEGIRVEGIIFH